ncbi:ABC transporter ATP-binding protein [Leptospira biflexa]|uniref:ABC transporter ATP-binding protein n=1 Tax=Leptospira biflexa TaxID=172 RepID=UPI0010917059|nr:ABC transporter ATP-binding protein [Leptospira biflexa]TGM42570.1 ABC transporter ATP-binding protein [Leptospira biflexa]TGM44456.1 ABC transporter ATP-binding protein [Leptospira biflexa]
MTNSEIKPTVSVRQLEKYYQVVDKRYHIISGLDFEVLPGEIVSVEGASGVGKSTLLNILGAMDSFDDGEVEVCGVSLKNLNEKQRESFRAEKISFIFQQHLLLPDFTALENVMMPLLIARMNPSIAKSQAIEILKKVGLGERTESFPSQLSGGESARVGVARALVGRRQLILADEPTGNLDRDNSRHLMDLIKELQNEFKFSLILVTHDLELASMAHKRNRIVSGKLSPVSL